MSPTAVIPNVAAAPQAKHRAKDALLASVCTKVPVNGLQVTQTSLTLAPTGSAQFTACTQYSSKYTITVSPSGVLTAPSSPSTVTPTVPQNTSIFSANITVTAGPTCGSATITVKDKKGNKQTVSVHVSGCSQTFTFTAPGGVQTFTVPSGVTQITADAVGASGGTGCSDEGNLTNPGGSGFELKASSIAVTPGQTLYVYVGGSPVATVNGCSTGVPSFATAGFNGGGTACCFGGGGGGASDIRTSSNDLTTRLIVAGGGGGGNGSCNTANGGNGGYPDGAAGGYCFRGTDPTSSLAGQGGTQDATGGAGGQLPAFQNQNEYCSGIQGSLGTGAATAASTSPDFGCVWAGAGGGGYYGGGSGAWYTIAYGGAGYSGAGGGSSFVQTGATVDPSSAVAKPGRCDANNNGCITITY
jgi:hypothetical protein